MLIDDGKLKLDDPLSKYIPSFAKTEVGMEVKLVTSHSAVELVPPIRPVTILDLMRHTSGISYSYIGANWVEQAYSDANLFEGSVDNKEFAQRISELPLTRQPGTLWRYGHSTDVLGRVIEVVSGQSLYEFMRQRIFIPLGMTSTKFVLKAPEELARMARPLPSDSILLDAERDRLAHPEWESGGGGLLTTIKDYARFAQMLLNGGELDGKRYISPASLKAMTSDQIGPGSGVDRDYFYFPGDGFGYGLGIAVRTDPGNAKPPPAGSIGELKWDSGSGTYFGVDPKFDMIYIVMQQTQNERGRITPAFKKLVYDAYPAN
jgi:CubicO group peptidase (beta-lactamase class C family)